MVLDDTPGLLSFLAGKPNASTFPIKSVSINIQSPAPPFTETTLTIEDRQLAQALQYGQVTGQRDLVDKLFEVQQFLHGRKRDSSWQISVVAGGQDTIYKLMQMFIDPEDVVLVEVSNTDFRSYTLELIFIFIVPGCKGSNLAWGAPNHEIMQSRHRRGRCFSPQSPLKEIF